MGTTQVDKSLSVGGVLMSVKEIRRGGGVRLSYRSLAEVLGYTEKVVIYAGG